jgi:uncharacterized protein DUF1206
MKQSHDPSAPSRPWLQVLARVGYAARGLVFVILAYFTAIAAFEAHRKPIDSVEALRVLLAGPFGTALLAIIAAGLVSFALWREAQAWLDPDGFGAEWKGLARRAAYAAAGLFYAVFASIALSMIIGLRYGDAEHAVHDWTAWLLDHRFGAVALGLIGGAIVVGAACIAVAGARAEFCERLALKEKPRLVVTALGCVGYLARAAVFAVIGGFLLFAAFDANAHEAKGLAGALLVIKRLPHGGAWLAVAALGLLAFGAYGLAEALFRRVDGDRLSFNRFATAMRRRVRTTMHLLT